MSNRREFLKGAGLVGAVAATAGVPIAVSGESKSVLQQPSSAPTTPPALGGITFENSEMRLVISSGGIAESLIHKPTGQECLLQGTGSPAFTVTQYRPYNDQLQLAYPAKVKHFPAEHVRREGDNLVVRFALVGYEATIGFKITDSYIAFHLGKLEFVGYGKTPFYMDEEARYQHIDEAVFLQLPVRTRANFGEWLNVMWDQDVAVNVLATDPHTRIDARPRRGYSLLYADSVRDVQLLDLGAALITTATPHLLDRIATVEADFNLPRGVESRRSKDYRFSYYQSFDLTPENVGEQIKYAKMAGMRTMNIPPESFLKPDDGSSADSDHSAAISSARRTLTAIRDAGIVPGLHIMGTMVSADGRYVRPKPDPRLSLMSSFTLARDLDTESTTIIVEENPRLCTMEEGKKVLRIQNELIAYDRFTTSRPFQFVGCQRAALGTCTDSHEAGSRVGLLDMYNSRLIRVSQDTDIEAEVARPLQELYNHAGFKFMYFDGSEQVPPPYWYTVARAQKVIYDGLEPRPLFSEGSCKAHFSWHMVTRGNAFDVFKPEDMKVAVRAYAAKEAPRVAKDFTSINFGWIGYFLPSKIAADRSSGYGETIGTQPDMIEYVTSCAAAWDCPISLSEGSRPSLLATLKTHPRTPDNLEVIRRWEEVRARSWLTAAQKKHLRELKQEHTLLLNEKDKFELTPWDQIENVASASEPGRAFLFRRNDKVWVAYWHTWGDGILEVSLPGATVRLMRRIGKSVAIHRNGEHIRLPLGDLRYLEVGGCDRQRVISAFQCASILPR